MKKSLFFIVAMLCSVSVFSQTTKPEPRVKDASGVRLPNGQQVLKVKEVVPQPDSNAGSSGEQPVFDVVEQMPSFPQYTYTVTRTLPDGSVSSNEIVVFGNEALMAYLSRNIRYPAVAEENGVQGRVILSFVVEPDGSITDVVVVKSVDPSLDREAVRVTRSMPRWIPGKQKGQAVRLKYTMPITFRLS